MLGHVVVIAHQGLEIVDRDGLFGREIDLEIAAIVDGLLDGRIEVLLHDPDARVVVDAVTLVVAGVGGGEVEGTFLGVPEAVLLRPAHDRGRAHHVLAFRIVFAQAALVARGHVLVGRGAVGDPLVARAGLEVPDLLAVDEADAEAFTAAGLLDDAAQKRARFARGRAAGEQNVGNVVLGDAGGLVVRVDRERVVAGEDGLGAGEAHARFVEAHGAVELGLPVRHGREAHAAGGLRPFEGGGALVVLRAVHRAFGPFARFVNHEVLGLEGAAVSAAGKKEGAVGRGLFSDNDGSAHLGCPQKMRRPEREKDRHSRRIF